MHPCSPRIAAALLVGVCLLAPPRLCAEPGAEKKMDTIEPDKEVVYRTLEDGHSLSLHVFLPPDQGQSALRPAVVFFFGGGWTGGNPKQFYQQAAWLAQRGYVGISAAYRVQQGPFVCVEDGRAALAWLRDHAEEFGIDPGKIIAAGGSAGGHVAASATMIPDGSGPLGPPAAAAMVLFNPVLDTTEAGYGLEKVGEERKTEISPVHHVRGGLPPTLIFHGTSDRTVPFENAERFTRLMNEAGNTCELLPFPGKGHGFFNGSRFQPKNTDADFEKTMQATREFLQAAGLAP